MILDKSSDFFDFGPSTYLNCAYHGPLPRVAAEALDAAVAMRKDPSQIQPRYHFTFPDAYRAAVGRMIGCPPRDVTVTDSTTHGIMLLVAGLDWRPGDRMVLPRGQFPANKLPWLSLEARGVVIDHVDIGSGDDLDDDPVATIERALTPRTRVVSVAWVSFFDGGRLDLGALSALCRERDVLFVVDGSQGIGGLPFDLAATPADLVACSGYKWLLGPYGLGFAYVAPALAERLSAPNVNWFSAVGARDFDRLASLPYAFGPGARRFDVNETASFYNLAPGIAALRYLTEVTPRAVEAHCQALHQRLIAGLPPGFSPLGADHSAERRSNILCLVGRDRATTRAALERLGAARIAVSSRESSIRVSPHIYNTVADIDRFLEVLGEAADGRRSRRPAALRVGESVDGDPAGVPGDRPLVGDAVVLEPLDPARHADDLYRASHGARTEALWTYMPYGPFADAQAMHGWLVSCAGTSDPRFYAVVDREHGRAVGMASFLRMAPEHRSIEVGHIWYTPAAQGTAINTETALLLLRDAFALGYRRVEWKCDALNRRSRAAALRLGFRFEGIFRQHRIVKGKNRDTAWFALLASDWPAIERRIVRWLARPAAERGRLATVPDLARRLHRLLDLPEGEIDGDGGSDAAVVVGSAEERR